MKRKILTFLLISAIVLASFIVVPARVAANPAAVNYVISTSEEFLSEQPFIIKGSLSKLNLDLQSFSKLKSFYDVNLLSEKPYLILVGENYSNLLTLILELNNDAPINITKDYPGKGIGVIEFFNSLTKNIYGKYQNMDIVILSGSDEEGTKNAINYFKEIINGKKSLKNGVIFVDSDLNEVNIPIKKVPLNYNEVRDYFNKFISVMNAEDSKVKQNILLLKNEIMENEGKIDDSRENLDTLMRAFLRFDNCYPPNYPTGIFTVLSDATDENLCKIALSTYEGNLLNKNSEYVKFVNTSMRHTAEMFSKDNYPWNAKECYSFRKENAHEMFLFNKYFGKVTGDCYAQAIFNEIIFRLWDFKPDEAFMLSIGGDKGGHVINLLNLNNGWFLFDSTHHSSPIFTGGYSNYFKYLRGFFNESMYTVFADYYNKYPSRSNMPLDEIKTIANSAKKLFAGNMMFGSRANHKSRINEFTPFKKFKSVVDEPLKVTIFDAIPKVPEITQSNSISSIDLATNDFLETIYKERSDLLENTSEYLSLLSYNTILKESIKYPISQYTTSRYAIQTVRVKNPEAYAMGALHAPKTADEAKKFEGSRTMSNVVDFVKDEINEIELLKPSQIVEYPDLTLFIKKGNPYSRSLFGYELLYDLSDSSERDSLKILWGPSGEAYIGFMENGKTNYIDCTRQEVKILNKHPDDIWVEFNDNGHKFFNVSPVLISNGVAVHNWMLNYESRPLVVANKEKKLLTLTVEDPNWEKTDKTLSISDVLLKSNEYKHVYDKFFENKDWHLLTLNSPAVKLNITSNVISDYYKNIEVYVDFSKLEDGQYYIPISVSNKYGHSGLYIYAFTLFKDTIPPTITLKETPKNYVNVPYVNIEFTVSDNKTPSNEILVLTNLDNSGWTKVENTNFLSLNNLPEGKHTLLLKAIDESGNESKIVKINFAVDLRSPSLTIISPQNYTTVNEDTVDITGKVTDDGSGVESVTVNGNAVTIDNNGTFSTTVSLMKGDNIITIVATDKAGNKTTKTITVTYKPQIIITLQPNNPMMTVNGVQQEIDPGRGTKPVIIPKWNRTVVPIRAIVEALGGTIGWDPVQRMVTINLDDNTINLWIGKPQAEVNGVMKWIDPNNHNVKPIIINDRTMLPLRFVAESLGCKVEWDAVTRTITITYTP